MARYDVLFDEYSKCELRSVLGDANESVRFFSLRGVLFIIFRHISVVFEY